MKLNILERLLATGAVAQYETEHPKNNFITLKTINKIKDKLLTTEEENKKYNLRVENDNFLWDESGTLEYVDFEFTEGEIKIVSEGLISLDKLEQLTTNHISLYEKFIPNVE